METFFTDSAFQHHPLRALIDFLNNEIKLNRAGMYEDMRVVGYVLDIGYEVATIITSDPFKKSVGGIPRNSFLIMVPQELKGITPHFTLLRVLETAPTPLSVETQQTFFELHKKSMPEIDVFTQADLQWGALKTSVLGMFYPHPEKNNEIEFSGDVNNIVSPHKYRVFSPNEELLDIIVNCLVPDELSFKIGDLRTTECRLPVPHKKLLTVPVETSTKDFIGARTALFGKTRLGKSNVVKLIAESIITNTRKNNNVGQIIFDMNGEYANDNPQDENASLKSKYTTECEVYALSPKSSTPSKPLRLNFYESPDQSMSVLSSFITVDKQSNYIESFASVTVPSIDEIASISNQAERTYPIRKVLMYWAILNRAGFVADEPALKRLVPNSHHAKQLNPGFSQALRDKIYAPNSAPSPPTSLDELTTEMEKLAIFRYENSGDPDLKSTGSGKDLFDSDAVALLEFLRPAPGRSGPTILRKYRMYHAPNASNYIAEIIDFVDKGKTVILDLGNASDEIFEYFSGSISKSIFMHQQDKFSNNKLGDHYIQLYFEEAHNLFPIKADPKSIYSRFAKEGAKYHIGIVYSTQSPSTVYEELLAQTENFFVGHLSSQNEASALERRNVAYKGLDKDIMSTKQPGYMRMLTRSHRFVIPVQTYQFRGKANL